MTTAEDRPPSRVPALVAALLLALTVVGMAQFRGMDPDFFWHVHTGGLYLAGARPDLADPYSWTAAGRYWLDHEWLGEVIWSVLWTGGGLGAVLAWQVGLLGGLLVLLFVLARQAGLGPRVAAVVAIAAIVLAFPWYLPRLQIYSGLGLSLVLLAVQRFYAGKAGGWLPLGMATLTALWANLHGGGAIIGPASLTIVLVAERLAGRRAGLGWLAAACGAGWLALALNPNGWRLPLFSVAAMLDPRLAAMNAMIHEWQPLNPTLRQDQEFLVWVAGLLLAWALARRRPPAGWLALGLVWLWLGGHANRNFPLAAIATTPLMAFFVASWPAWPAWRRSLGAVLAVVGLAALALRHPALEQGRGALGSVGFAGASSSALAALRKDGAGRRLLNWYSWGGEVIFACGPAVKVFIDGRQYVYGVDLNRDYFVMEGARPGWEALLAHHGVDAAFFPPDWPLTNVLRHRPGWRVAFEDPTAILVVKEVPARR